VLHASVSPIGAFPLVSLPRKRSRKEWAAPTLTGALRASEDGVLHETSRVSRMPITHSAARSSDFTSSSISLTFEPSSRAISS
jgi:hypothetical protein